MKAWVIAIVVLVFAIVNVLIGLLLIRGVDSSAIKERGELIQEITSEK